MIKLKNKKTNEKNNVSRKLKKSKNRKKGVRISRRCRHD
jgi:hypothetical protein